MANWYRRVFALAIPLILSNLTQPLLSTVDTVLSGHLPGAAALGGVAMGGIFFNAVFWTFGFLRMGTTGLVAQSHGAEDPHAIRLHFWRGLASALAIGVLVWAVRAPLIALALTLLGGAGDVRQNAALYCHVRIWSAPAALANFVVLGFLLGRQRARTALALQASINVVNVAVALWLVVRLHWGVAGIATATMTADYAGLLTGLVLTWVAWPRAAAQPVRLSELLHAASLRRLFALNRDLFLRTLSLVAAYGWFTRAGAREGDAILAANAVLLNLHWIATYALDGFANATEALVGEAVGAGRRGDYRSILRASTVSAAVVAVLLSLGYLVAGAPLVALFTNVAPVRALALRFLPWAILLPLVSVWGYQLDGIFIGATRARELRDSMVFAFAGFLVLAIALERAIGNHGLWCAFCCFMILRGLLLGAKLPRIGRAFPDPAPLAA
ncbi:MAG TPA: MATE family efflux transporter [Terracidiphilus sp.]|nr:MATE family efflux transporter [Terracidiphilus sp.]